MSLIMNERIEAEKILSTHRLGDKPSEAISLLARYYWQNINTKTKKKDINQLLTDFLGKHLPNYNADDWDGLVTKYIEKAKSYPLIEINEIPITQNEIQTIKDIAEMDFENKTIAKVKKLQKLAFTMLVLAKFGNMRNKSNNNWCTVDDTTIFKLARVSGNTKDQCICFYDLMKVNLITYSKRIDNLNVRVNFIDTDSKVVLNVTDFRELGWQWLNYCGEKFLICKKCGVLIKDTINNKMYCSECAGYQPLDVKTLVCCDCGDEFTVLSSSRNKKRCDKCQKKYRRIFRTEKQRQYRKNNCGQVH